MRNKTLHSRGVSDFGSNQEQHTAKFQVLVHYKSYELTRHGCEHLQRIETKQCKRNATQSNGITLIATVD